MNIVSLADHPKFIPELAKLHFAEWSYLNPGETLAEKTERLKSLCGRDGVPSFFIAVEGAELVGSASLVPQDMDNRPDLTPWLADVFVKPRYRGRGIASRLVKRVEAEAKSAGIAKLYLYTPGAVELYQRLGWVVEEQCKYKGADVIIMSRTIK